MLQYLGMVLPVYDQEVVPDRVQESLAARRLLRYRLTLPKLYWLARYSRALPW